jgi:ribonuclease E
VLESHTHQDGLRSEPAGEERRDRRSRDRYGRDRRERGDRQPRDEAAAPTDQPFAAQPGDAESQERTPRYPTGFVTEEAEGVPQAAPQNAAAALAAPAAPVLAPAAPQVPAAPARREPAAAQPVAAQPAAAATPSRALPKVSSYDLPVDQLVQVAEGSGLQWVNSDAQKIAAVQAAIAAEPKPARVPRERPPAVVIDEGPLVLVETRRDLRDMKLPFEQTSLPLQ